VRVEHCHDLLLIDLDLGKDWCMLYSDSSGGWLRRWYNESVQQDDIDHAIKAGNMLGNDTLHRVVPIHDPQMGTIIGATIRFGKRIEGLAIPFMELICQERKSILVIGGVLTGKSTLLRDFVRVLSLERRLLTIDSHGHIGELNTGARRCLADTKAHLQRQLMYEAVVNLGYDTLVVDDIGWSKEEVTQVISVRDMGVQMVAGLRSSSLLDAKANSIVGSLMHSFDLIVELADMYHWNVYDANLEVVERWEITDDKIQMEVQEREEVWQCEICESDNAMKLGFTCSICLIENDPTIVKRSFLE